MKSYRIASDTPVDVRPNESGAEAKRVRTQRGVFTHKELLGEIRKKETPRVIHSDGFLSLSGLVDSAYECQCGFFGVFKATHCVRCGAKI